MGSREGAARGGRPSVRLVLLVLGLSVAALPSPAWADVYTWVDERGIQHFVGDAGDIPERVRGRARLFIGSTGSGRGEPAPAPPEVPLASPERMPAPPPPMDQDAFAVSLAERLGLANRPTPPEAAAVLAQRRILPPGGWLLGGAISPGWLADLARSLLAASSAGLIPHAPEEAFGIMEALAAEAGVTLVPIEPPPSPPPPLVEVPVQGVIIESVLVPVFRFRHAPLPHDRDFRKRGLTDRGERHAHRRPATVSRRKPAEEASGRFHRLGDGFHRLGTGFHRLGTGFHRAGRPQSPPRRGHR